MTVVIVIFFIMYHIYVGRLATCLRAYQTVLQFLNINHLALMIPTGLEFIRINHNTVLWLSPRDHATGLPCDAYDVRDTDDLLSFMLVLNRLRL